MAIGMNNIQVTDMHTGGEPLRIITSGYPTILGKTLLEKRRYVKENLDYLRTFLMHEPRGHYDQYGALLVEPDFPDCDIGVIFLTNEGYSTMCGHACIALGRFLVDNDMLKNKVDDQPEALAKIQCPCGVVDLRVEINNGKSGAAVFTSVPAFLYQKDVIVSTQNYGNISLDLGYGGAFYALVDMTQKMLLDFEKDSLDALKNFADEVSQNVKKKIEINHPVEKDLSFLYGTILTDGKDDSSNRESKHLTIFADKQVDRSPTGSGVTARLAVQYFKGSVDLDQEKTFINWKTGTKFIGKVVEKASFGNCEAVRVEVSGHAYYTGKSTFMMEDDDPLKHGFLVR